MLHRRPLTLAIAILLASSPVAHAASATQDAYNDDSDVQVQKDTDTSPTKTKATAEATPSATTASSLPFTGLEAGLIGAAGLGLAGTGLFLRRAAREQG
ncbi:MAG: hypothetical protein AAGC46_03950 [Solirubrobacteraceae bacterium]|nr:hypothetical protein [Patulibacter sp.]